MVSVEELKELMFYQDGKMVWKVNKGSAKAGSTVGSPDKDGYLKTSINRKMYRLNRLVWFYHYGVWPINKIDHKDGDNTNDKVDNLREATSQQNQFNKKSFGKYSKHKGVTWHKRDKRWQASYQLDGTRVYIGNFDTEEEAAKAYQLTVKPLHKEFYRDT